MKKSRISIVLLAAATFVLSAIFSQAVPLNPTFSFFENGQGKLELPTGAVIPIPGTLTSDPGPGGLSSALTFTTHPQEELFVAGDVILIEPGGAVSDILRFDPGISTPAGLTQRIFFYSVDISGGLLADTGLPSALYSNNVVIFENHSGPTAYTPTASQPGFEAGFPFPITYQIFSTPDTGSTLMLFGAAFLGLMFLRRKIMADSGKAESAACL